MIQKGINKHLQKYNKNNDNTVKKTIKTNISNT